MSPFVWIGVAAVMGIIEALSFGIVAVWFVVGSLVAFLAGMLGVDLLVQCGVFLVVSVVLLIACRPLVLKYRKRGSDHEPTLVGSHAVVTEAIDNDRMVGRVETPDHMTWSARSFDGRPIHRGESVTVVAQESIKLIVERG